MPSWIVIVAGGIIAILVLMWLIKVIKATAKTAILIAAMVFALNFFGVGPGNLVKTMIDTVMNVTGGGQVIGQ
ncbi:hypothetical protein IQ266_00895 [filamentous cyanobacterium LEGE 11480]|uniref:Uncharacterized protein n=1 Tax=Romeriopsis navalis LEGE 11480 TaxID=2777977 RepID=A0A928VL07_9CYAN|nr:hypothetical protein [Romeriopsis navalis]MBE9028312.1 hypothetical protein [Romeriopsis navalis LEGE 11480]